MLKISGVGSQAIVLQSSGHFSQTLLAAGQLEGGNRPQPGVCQSFFEMGTSVAELFASCQTAAELVLAGRSTRFALDAAAINLQFRAAALLDGLLQGGL